jgi:hypothetical protein
MQINSLVDYFLGFMLLVKVVFLFSAMGHVITVKSKNPKIQQHEQLMRYISDTTEMIFIFGMSLFLIYYFVPNKKIYVIKKEPALLLFAYGFVTLIAALKRYHLMPSQEEATKKDSSISTSTPPLSPATLPQQVAN